MTLPPADVEEPAPSPSPSPTALPATAPSSAPLTVLTGTVATPTEPDGPVPAVTATGVPATGVPSAGVPATLADATPTAPWPETVELPALSAPAAPRDLVGRSALDSLIDGGPRSFHVPLVLVLALGGYAALQRRLGRGTLPMTAELPASVDPWRRPGDDHARYLL
jgi:hypothetical protein